LKQCKYQSRGHSTKTVYVGAGRAPPHSPTPRARPNPSPIPYILPPNDSPPARSPTVHALNARRSRALVARAHNPRCPGCDPNGLPRAAPGASSATRGPRSLRPGVLQARRNTRARARPHAGNPGPNPHACTAQPVPLPLGLTQAFSPYSAAAHPAAAVLHTICRSRP